MALDHLLAALEREARAEADELLAAARADAAQRTTLADAAIARRREAALGGRAREQQAELEAALSAARLAARREVLDARERLVERVFDAVRAACGAAVTRADFVAGLPARAAAALTCVGACDAVVLSAPAPLAAILAQGTTGDGRVTVREDAGAGAGFRLATADGSLEVVDTIEARIAARRAALARRALALLGLAP